MQGYFSTLLLKCFLGLDVNVKFSDGWNPLLLAASTGEADLASMLISRGADINVKRGH